MSPHISVDRDTVSTFCRRHHITRLALFGSVLRDDFSPDSDVDVLVELQAGHVPGLDFVTIERELPTLAGPPCGHAKKGHKRGGPSEKCSEQWGSSQCCLHADRVDGFGS